MEAFLQMKSHLVPPLKLSLRMYVRDHLDFEGEHGIFYRSGLRRTLHKFFKTFCKLKYLHLKFN